MKQWFFLPMIILCACDDGNGTPECDKSLCGEQCVELNTNEHCGACDIKCGETQSCEQNGDTWSCVKAEPRKLGVYVPVPVTDFIANVKDEAYGAKGDGATDDTTAIQKAIDATAGKGGGIVDIPAGTYMIDTSKNILMRSHVILRMDAACILKSLPGEDGSYTMIRMDNLENAHILGGTLSGNIYEIGSTGPRGGFGVWVLSSRNVVIENVTAKDFFTDGFLVSRYYFKDPPPENIIFYNVVSDGNKRQGMSVTDGKNIKVLNSVFKNTYGNSPQSGIDIEPNPSIYSPLVIPGKPGEPLERVPGKVVDVEIRDSLFENNAVYGIVVSANLDATIENVRLIDNRLFDNMSGILLNGLNGGQAIGNTIKDNDSSIPYFDIELTKAKNIEIRDNELHGGRLRTDGELALAKNENISTKDNRMKPAVFVKGFPKVGETLKAYVINASQTPPQNTFRCQWLADNQPIDGAQETTYRVQASDAGKKINVRVEFTDTNEIISGKATMAVDLPGIHAPHNLIFNGRLNLPEKQPGILAGNLIVKDNDIGDRHDFTLSDNRFEVTQEGKLKLKDGIQLKHEGTDYFSVCVTATDSANKTISDTIRFKIVTEPPVESKNKVAAALINGYAKVGQTLRAVATDPDGEPDSGIVYQWYANCKAISGATQSSYQVRDDDIDRQIVVRISFTDKAGHKESIMSLPTLVVKNAAP